MKKYLPPISAIVLALILSAFQYEPKKEEVVLKWYHVTYDSSYPLGAIYPGSPDYDGTRTEVSTLVPCIIGSRPCVLGFPFPISFPNNGQDPLTSFTYAEDSFDESP